MRDVRNFDHTGISCTPQDLETLSQSELIKLSNESASYLDCWRVAEELQARQSRASSVDEYRKLGGAVEVVAGRFLSLCFEDEPLLATKQALYDMYRRASQLPFRGRLARQYMWLERRLLSTIARIERFQVLFTWNIKELRRLAHEDLICLSMVRRARRKAHNIARALIWVRILLQLAAHRHVD